MRPGPVAALAAVVLAASAPAASAGALGVNVQFSDFNPTPLDVLPGETVEWSNVSERRHTVTADDGSFDSGDLFQGDRFAKTFDTVGTYAYHCTVHAGMVGEVDVRRVTLGPLPILAISAGDPVEMDGRTADPAQPVTIERDTGSGFRPVATVNPSADGAWKTTVRAQTTGDYRAVSGADTSETRRLLVSDRKVSIRATRRGVAVSVIPKVPYARIALQQDLRERFGWWSTLFTQLDYLSEASIRVQRPARVRVVLVDRDGWTPLATSPVLTLGAVGKRRMPQMQHPAHH